MKTYEITLLKMVNSTAIIKVEAIDKAEAIQIANEMAYRLNEKEWDDQGQFECDVLGIQEIDFNDNGE